jgi:alkanesulfonate monooxygenase SsuD/methylene tetrahydromethanopterin reductase-like flavin-dependent oxidoreductase (luciferase family)
MEIGYFAVGIGSTVNPEPVRTVATTAERLGFSTIWAPEHVVLLDQYASKYPYSAGEFPAPTDTPIADPFTTLAFAAAAPARSGWGRASVSCPSTTRLSWPRPWQRSTV